jgi:mannose/cellobiose epimerase-like protein (N-acyl-D-glucosamine 2-epimerase family)
VIDHLAERQRLLRFARAAADVPTGFAWLDERGVPDPAEPVHTWITTRMTYVFALAELAGESDAVDGQALELAEHGVRALRGPLRDAEHGGWFASVSAEGVPLDTRKQAYAHAFVVLAGATAAVAGVRGGEDLLADALAVVERCFLDDRGRVVDELSTDLGGATDYRGANSSMHMVEAFLAAADATGDAVWRRRALAIAEHLVHDVARDHLYLLPEHFGPDWEPLPDYNRDDPADPFRPFGCTPGHLLEWARLLLHLEAGIEAPPRWLPEDARGLFDAAVESGWGAGGAPGFAYTVDWERRPVVRSRMHWVHAEALAAAAALHSRTGDRAYAGWQQTFEDYVEEYLMDLDHGSWHHELDADNLPAATVWHGKPDVYHAYQALLLTELPLAPVAAVQLRDRRDAGRPGR